MHRTTLSRTAGSAFLGLCVCTAPCLLAACDSTEHVDKTTTVKSTNTPDGVKKTVETTEKKVETQNKTP